MLFELRTLAFVCVSLMLAGCAGIAGSNSGTPPLDAPASKAHSVGYAQAKTKGSLLYLGGFQGILVYKTGMNDPMPIAEIDIPFVQGQAITSLAVDTEGVLYVGTEVADGGALDGSVFVYPPGSKKPSYRIPGEITALTLDGNGSLYVCCTLDLETAEQSIHVYPRGGVNPVRTIPIPSPPASAALVGRINGMALDKSQNLFLAAALPQGADFGGHIFELHAGKGVPSALPLSGLYTPSDVKFDARGNMFVTDVCERTGCIAGGIINAYKPGRKKPYFQIIQNSIDLIAFDAAGDLYAADANDGNLFATLGYHPGNASAFAVITAGSSDIPPFAIAAYPPVFPR